MRKRWSKVVWRIEKSEIKKGFLVEMYSKMNEFFRPIFGKEFGFSSYFSLFLLVICSCVGFCPLEF